MHVCAHISPLSVNKIINGMTNWTTRARVCGCCPVGSAVGVGFGVAVAGWALGITDGEIKIYLVTAPRKGHPPPRHMLCNPDSNFVYFRLSIWV